MGGLDRFRDENQQLYTPEINEDIDSPEEPRSRFEVSRETTESISEVDRNILRNEVTGEVLDGEDDSRINESTFSSRFNVDEDQQSGDITPLPENPIEDQIEPNKTSFEINPEQIHLLNEYFEAHKPEIDSVIGDVENEMERIQDNSLVELQSLHSSFVLGDPFQEDGSHIQSELERILELGEDEQILVHNGEQELTFESKRDALIYLYYVKYSLKQVEVFIKNLDDAPYSEAYKIALITALVAWIGFSTIGSLRRGIGKILYGFNIGQRITATSRPEGSGKEQAKFMGEFTEYSQRSTALELAREVFQGNESISDKLGSPSYELFIDARTENVRGGVRIEQSFWRNLSNIVYGRGVISQSIDVFLKPYYANSRDGTPLLFRKSILKTLENSARVRKEALAYFEGANGQSDINNLISFMELDHDVPNSKELEVRGEFDKVKNDLLSGNIDFIFGMKLDKAKDEIRKRLAVPILGNNATKSKITSIIGDGSNSKPGEGGKLVRSEVSNFQFLTNINSYGQTLIARTLEARLDGENYNPDVIRGQLESFFASIGNEGGLNRYTHYSAQSVIEKILSGQTKQQAISASETESGNDLRERIKDTDYLSNQNAQFNEQLERRIIAQANAISSADELRLFQDNILDEMRDTNDKFWPGFQSAGRSIDRIVADKEAELGIGQERIIIDEGTTDEVYRETEPERTTPEVSRSETLLQRAGSEGILNKRARDIVTTAEYIMRANEFSTISGLTHLTPQIESQLRHLRATGDLPDGTNVGDMSISDMRGALRTQLGLFELPININEAQRIFSEAQQPDRDLRITIEAQMGVELIDGEPRSWEQIYRDDKFMFTDKMTDNGRASLQVLRNPSSPAEAIRNARMTIENIFRNMR